MQRMAILFLFVACAALAKDVRNTSQANGRTKLASDAEHHLSADVIGDSATAKENGASKPELIISTTHTTVVTGVAFDRESNVVATTSNDSVLKLWSFPQG